MKIESTTPTNQNPNQKNIAIGVSFPREIVAGIDALRGDTSRSRYMLRLLEIGLNDNVMQRKRVAIIKHDK